MVIATTMIQATAPPFSHPSITKIITRAHHSRNPAEAGEVLDPQRHLRVVENLADAGEEEPEVDRVAAAGSEGKAVVVAEDSAAREAMEEWAAHKGGMAGPGTDPALTQTLL